MLPSVTCSVLPKHVIVRQCALVPQWMQTLKLSVTTKTSKNNAETAVYAYNRAEAVEFDKKLQASFEKDTDHRRLFANVAVTTMPELRKYLHDEFKLRFVKEREVGLKATWRPVEGVGTTAPQSGGAELLFNIAAKHDYWLVDKRRHHNMLYYRLELMRQRLEYLRSCGMDARQKLRDIQRCPPPLVLTMTNSTYYGKLIYLRGLVAKEDGKSHVHVFTSVAKQIRESKPLIDDRIESMCTQLDLSLPAVLHELLNMPCFFMDPNRFQQEDAQGNMASDHLFVHLRSMPRYYNMDEHTMPLLPPICNLKSLGIDPKKHLRWSTARKDLLALPTWTLEEILDVTYPSHNGKGTPECLTTFLLRSDGEEHKLRKEGGEVMKPRKGFNIRPRQY
jgi:hypothetical protein